MEGKGCLLTGQFLLVCPVHIYATYRFYVIPWRYRGSFPTVPGRKGTYRTEGDVHETMNSINVMNIDCYLQAFSLFVQHG